MVFAPHIILALLVVATLLVVRQRGSGCDQSERTPQPGETAAHPKPGHTPPIHGHAPPIKLIWRGGTRSHPPVNLRLSRVTPATCHRRSCHPPVAKSRFAWRSFSTTALRPDVAG